MRRPSQSRKISALSERRTITSANFKEFLELELQSIDSPCKKWSVIVMPDNEYMIDYYSSTTNSIIRLKCLVKNFAGSDEDQIIHVVYLRDENKEPDAKIICPRSCKNFRRCHPEMVSPEQNICIGRCPLLTDKTDTLSRYIVPDEDYIPVSNILNIEYIGQTPIIPREEEKVFIVILGIGVDIMRILVINMKVIDDHEENCIRNVSLEPGKRYHVVFSKPNKTPSTMDQYCCANTVYELEGNLVKIDRMTDYERSTNTSASTVRCMRCDHPEEIVGIHNSIYCAEDVSTDKDKFLAGEPVKEDFRLYFDTTYEAMHGMIDNIQLSWIRDIYEVEDEDSTTSEEDNTMMDKVESFFDELTLDIMDTFLVFEITIDKNIDKENAECSLAIKYNYDESDTEDVSRLIRKTIHEFIHFGKHNGFRPARDLEPGNEIITLYKRGTEYVLEITIEKDDNSGNISISYKKNTNN